MVDVDSLSDAQLRAKLMEFGFPVMPITGTTRKVMTKKLKILLENKNKSPAKDNRRSLGRFSSDDDSDADVKIVKKSDRSRRATMAAPTMQPPSSKVSAKRISRNDSNENTQKEIKQVKTSTTTRTMKILEASKRDEYDTGSESDEIAENYPNYPSTKKPLFEETFKKYSPIKKTVTTTTYDLNTDSPSTSSNDRFNQVRSRLTMPTTSSSPFLTSNYDRPLYTSSPAPTTTTTLKDDLIDDNSGTPFLSNFTRRLSQLREIPKSNNSYDYKNEIIKENDVNNGGNGGGFSATNLLNSYRSRVGRYNTIDYKTNQQQQQQNGYYGFKNNNILKNNYVSVMVLVVAFLFFMFLAIIYLGLRSDTALEAAAIVPLCAKNEPNNIPFINCIKEDDKRNAFNLLKAILPELENYSIKYKCKNNGKSFMTESDIVDFIEKVYGIWDKKQIFNDLLNVELLVILNPNWGVNLVQFKDDDFSQEYVLRDMVNKEDFATTALMINNPKVPWNCYLYKKISVVFNLILSIIIGFLILFALNYLYKYYKQFKQKEKEDEIQLIENIIEILQTNCNNDDKNYLVINHVRDMILPVNQRKNKERIWRRAVQYINENESRIRTEIQIVRGEPSEVWRWLGGNTSFNKAGSNNSSKTWQGQAFETQMGSVNSLPCSPTPCLKIRGMIEDGDRNTILIKKAVLNKCANECRILHCAVDTNMKCVYLKCAHTSDAAIAYRNLHGWWYAGNLVTVKYIRLERYMQRFPDSPSNGPYLKASGDW